MMDPREEVVAESERLCGSEGQDTAANVRPAAGVVSGGSSCVRGAISSGGGGTDSSGGAGGCESVAGSAGPTRVASSGETSCG